MTMDTPTNPIAPTSRWMAAARARESERGDRLFDDPLAAALATRWRPAGAHGICRRSTPWRTPCYAPLLGDFLLYDCRRLVCPGRPRGGRLDTRVFRLNWPPSLSYERTSRGLTLKRRDRGSRSKISCERVRFE